MQNNYNNQVTLGGFFVRLAAFMLDCFIVGIGSLFIRMFFWGVSFIIPLGLLKGTLLFSITVEDIILYACGATYFIILTYYTGTTLGKKALNLRVVNKNGGKLTLFNVIYRETIGRFLCSIILGIGYIMVGLDVNKQGLHDHITDTFVIYEKIVRIRPIPVRRSSVPQPMNQPPMGQLIGNNIEEGNSQNEQRGF